MVFFKCYNLETIKLKNKLGIMFKFFIQIHIFGKSISNDCATLLVCYKSA